jgi:demethylmenaquinone methyltransferase/2-methoxy-6-polyprenyl-1,4-benzoquinol methylase
MSSLALMRWLESSPDRYDAGMRWITLGRVTRLHEAIAEAAARPGSRVLEIGCGTGAVTARLVARGAHVDALDQNPEMLERARSRLGTSEGEPVTWIERTASEIDTLPSRSYDAVVASLSLSEMSGNERAFVLRDAATRLRPGGVLVVGDEVRPPGRGLRLLHVLLRAPQAAAGWLLAGSLSRPIRDLAGELQAAGFRVRSRERLLLGSLCVLVAEPCS